ncbi:Hypothetical predicted protein [Podarcis lilfordi]|uniref:Uncharacterized protein n=1 Tax=Podarcis lilfordi TaxID=74358 RepID=A0AA35JX60_9SAUR|nr:Hypothetical predicted protein [Podarcis lilfordi]
MIERDHPGGPFLALQALEVGAPRASHLNTLPSSGGVLPTAARTLVPSKSIVAMFDCMTFERSCLKHQGLDTAVIFTILASCRPSTVWIYQATWTNLSTWCFYSEAVST